MNMIHTIQRRLMIRRAVRELSQLSDHILLDIGIERADINIMAEKTIDSRLPAPTGAPAPVVYETAPNNFRVASGAPA